MSFNDESYTGIQIPEIRKYQDLNWNGKDACMAAQFKIGGYVGGTALGAKYLYDEVPPGVAWCDR